MQDILFFGGLFSLSIFILRFMNVTECNKRSRLLLLNSTPLDRYTMIWLLIYLLLDNWDVPSLGLLQIMML